MSFGSVTWIILNNLASVGFISMTHIEELDVMLVFNLNCISELVGSLILMDFCMVNCFISHNTESKAYLNILICNKL